MAVTARVGVDIGGTFTDTAAIDRSGRLSIGKTLTTPERAVDGVLASVAASGASLAETDIFVHGTTMVINALLERRGCRTAIVTTKGFADVVALGRGNRPEIFNPFYRRNPPLVPPELRFEIDERMTAAGVPLRDPSPSDIADVIERVRASGAEAVAVAFLHAYKNAAHESAVAQRLRAALPDVFVATSSELGKQWREYERFTTATANAYVGPLVKRYVGTLVDQLREHAFAGDALFLDAGGGAVGRATVEQYPIRLVESGPVGGVIASAAIAARRDLAKVVTLDIGGTTAKAALIEDFRFETLEEYWIGGYERGLPIQVPVVDIHEVGAGGGSIAWLDYGRLRVGPRSAGAAPGPACYGNGGTAATVTDALVYCGRIHPDCFIASIALRPDLATGAIEKLARTLSIAPSRLALGILELANASIAAAVRSQTLERGRDPREFTMIVSGGAGPAQACDVADIVGIRSVLVPRSPGHLSAIGMLQAGLRFSTRSIVDRPLADLSLEDFAALRAEQEAILGKLLAEQSRFAGEHHTDVSLGLRYAGQDHHLRLPVPESAFAPDADPHAMLARDFRDSYRMRYGYVDEQSPIEVVDIEVALLRDLPAWNADEPAEGVLAADAGLVRALFDETHGFVEAASWYRPALAPAQRIAGPALIYEAGTITVVPPAWQAEVLDDGNLMLHREGAAR